jgi:hypothetical protein
VWDAGKDWPTVALDFLHSLPERSHRNPLSGATLDAAAAASLEASFELAEPDVVAFQDLLCQPEPCQALVAALACQMKPLPPLAFSRGSSQLLFCDVASPRDDDLMVGRVEAPSSSTPTTFLSVLQLPNQLEAHYPALITHTISLYNALRFIQTQVWCTRHLFYLWFLSPGNGFDFDEMRAPSDFTNWLRHIDTNFPADKLGLSFSGRVVNGKVPCLMLMSWNETFQSDAFPELSRMFQLLHPSPLPATALHARF